MRPRLACCVALKHLSLSTSPLPDLTTASPLLLPLPPLLLLLLLLSQAVLASLVCCCGNQEVEGGGLGDLVYTFLCVSSLSS